MQRFDLPPAFRLILAADGRPPLGHARAACRSGSEVDGLVVCADRPDRLDCVFVLEPEAPGERETAACLLALAAADMLGAVLPPRLPLLLHRPCQIDIDGVVTIAIHVEDEPEGPLLLGFDLPLATVADGKASLAELGAETPPFPDLLGQLCRHFLRWVRLVEAEGMAPAIRAWNARTDDEQDRMQGNGAGAAGCR